MRWWLIALSLLLSTAADANPLRYSFAGKSLWDEAPFAFTLVVDQTVPDANPDPHSGNFSAGILESTWNGMPLVCGFDRTVQVSFDVETGNPAIPFVDALYLGCGHVLVQLITSAGLFADDTLPTTLNYRAFDWIKNVQANGVPSYGVMTQASVTEVPEPLSALLVLTGFLCRRKRVREVVVVDDKPFGRYLHIA